MAQWLIPWTGRGKSGPVNDRFLWNDGRVYVMDNHRLALWCWWQHLSEATSWTYLHVDRHYDALWLKWNPWRLGSTPIHRTDLTSFREAKTDDGGAHFELYRWDTITSALWSLHGDVIREVIFASGDEGDDPFLPRSRRINPWKLPELMAYLAEADDSGGLPTPCIADIDLDYFTHHDLDGAFGQVFSDGFIEEIGESLYEGVESGRFGVATIALSPETTGSWDLAEHILSKLLLRFPNAPKLLQQMRPGTF